MKKLAAAGLILMLKVTWCGAADTQPSHGTTTAATTNPATQASTRPAYVDPVYGFTIVPPKLGDDPKARTVAVIIEGPPNKQASSPTLNVLIEPMKTSRKEYISTARDRLKEVSAKVNAIKEVNVNGLEGAIFDYERSNDTRQLHFLQLCVIGPDVVYIVTCAAPVDTFADLKDEFQKSLDSFIPPNK